MYLIINTSIAESHKEIWILFFELYQNSTLTPMTGQWRHAKNDSGAIYGEISQLVSAWSKVSVMLINEWHRQNELLGFPRFDLNAG